MKVVIPRNPLHRLTCFHLLFHSSGRLKGPVSGKACAVLGRAEVVINVHFLTAAHNNHVGKGAVPIAPSLLVE